ncbi:akirin-2 isoform X1 [Equus asinus]|uniref:Akirin-2 n=2 Tax=Equus TaxID=9789 RepID=A0A9L0JSK6_EQUAS
MHPRGSHPMRTRPEAAGFESAALLLTPYWGRRRVEESYSGGGSGWTCSLELRPPPLPRNPSASTAALELLPLPRRLRSRVPASYLTKLVSTSEGSRCQRRSASGAAQSSNGRRGRPEPLPGEPRRSRRKSPPDAAGASCRHRPSRSRPRRPGPLPCRGGSGGGGSRLPAGVRQPPSCSRARRLGSPRVRTRPLPSPSPTSPKPGASAAPAMACGATLKRTLDFDPLLSPASPKRRRCAPLSAPTSAAASPSSAAAATAASFSAAAASPQKYLRMEPSPFGDVSSRLTTEQILYNIKQEYKRMQKRRHLETSFQQTDPCCTSDAQPHAFLLSGPASPGASSATSSPLKKEQPLFTLRQVGMICERLLKEREEKVREEYEEILNTKLAEQYDAFVKFTHDQIMRRYGEQPASYVS